MADGADEVKTDVDTVVLDVAPVQSRLVPQVLVVLLVDVVDDWLPTTGRKREGGKEEEREGGREGGREGEEGGS